MKKEHRDRIINNALSTNPKQVVTTFARQTDKSLLMKELLEEAERRNIKVVVLGGKKKRHEEVAQAIEENKIKI